MGEPAIELVKGLDLNGAQRADLAVRARNLQKDVAEHYRGNLEELAVHLAGQLEGERRS